MPSYIYIYELALTFFEAREGCEIEKIVITLSTFTTICQL